MKTIGFIGCGNLAQAIIKGIINTGTLNPRQIWASDRTSAKLKAFAKQTGIKIAENNKEILGRADAIFLATKPQDLMPVLDEICCYVRKNQTVVSLAAGVEGKLISKKIPQAKAVVRVMANTPAQIQKGVYGIYFAKADAHTKKTVTKIFGNLGQTLEVKSDDMIDAITSGSASGVGFVFEFMRVFEKWFTQNGFSSKQAHSMVTQVFLGTAALAQSQPQNNFESLRELVTSKKGTTLAGLTSMKKDRLEQVLGKGLTAGKRRAREISKSLRRTKK